MPVSVAVAGPVDETARILRRFGVLSQHGYYLNTNIKKVFIHNISNTNTHYLNMGIISTVGINNHEQCLI